MRAFIVVVNLVLSVLRAVFCTGVGAVAVVVLMAAFVLVGLLGMVATAVILAFGAGRALLGIDL